MVRPVAEAGDVTIRLASVGDEEDLARIHVEGWRWGYRGVMPDEHLASLSIEARAARWREIFASSPVETHPTWIARDEIGALGFASCGPARGEGEGVGELYAIYVVERAAGQGVASALMREALVHLRGAGYARAILWVLDANPRARRFYEREGWALDGHEKSEPFGGRVLREVRYAIAP